MLSTEYDNYLGHFYINYTHLNLISVIIHREFREIILRLSVDSIIKIHVNNQENKQMLT